MSPTARHTTGGVSSTTTMADAGSVVRRGSTRTTMCLELSGVPTSRTIGVRHVDVAAFVKGLICRRPKYGSNPTAIATAVRSFVRSAYAYDSRQLTGSLGGLRLRPLKSKGCRLCSRIIDENFEKYRRAPVPPCRVLPFHSRTFLTSAIPCSRSPVPTPRHRSTVHTRSCSTQRDQTDRRAASGHG